LTGTARREPVVGRRQGRVLAMAAPLAKANAKVQDPAMKGWGAFLVVAGLAACATESPQPASYVSAAAPLDPAPDAAERSPSASAGPSDWALAIVGTPFVFAFRTAVCAATAVVAAPTAGLVALSDEREAGLDYLRWGLAENCDGPYALSVPVAAGYRAEPDVPYAPQPDFREYPEPDLAPPRPLAPYGPSP
jgi:hypothetical protein